MMEDTTACNKESAFAAEPVPARTAGPFAQRAVLFYRL